jgi:hypothetical protein
VEGAVSSGGNSGPSAKLSGYVKLSTFGVASWKFVVIQL